MANECCDFRFLLIFAAVAFIYLQSEYADRLAAAVESENHCTSQMRLLIDQISMQQGRLVALDEERKRKEEECTQLKALVKEFERKGLQRVINKEQAPVAAVVIIACNRADYLERTVKSVLKYQSSVASKYPLFVSQDGSNQDVKSKALSFDQLLYMQMVMRIPYKDQSDFERIAGQFGVFEEWKDGVPRTAYEGVVFFRYQTSRRIFLIDPDSLKQLGIADA
ncbi:alpha-1 3-mannosyl-glycoprotein 2-beta-N-acetylglucosaminyltransferase [Tripterygium wilfordii]|uniref:Alpha-1,3-mannosyl-glycoprotein 2-beta-N-acetylglucosaminyltransferase n=1 Tax=Tripterygium wilfordii TaxID=458696 RepID=A0A7J7DHI5_TRIWF|nr:alpha-1 3-mannosyl-glycoprotein 2-beta-N-acetylglucosaminyltransferase [Tripterygium wilfordii]